MTTTPEPDPMREAATELNALRALVTEYLNQLCEDEVTGSSPSWPSKLETAVSWAAPEEYVE